MIIETFRQALQNVWSNKLRTFLTMLGIIIGVMAVIVIVGLGNGMTQSMRDSFSALGTNEDLESASSGREKCYSKENWADRIAFALYTLKNYEGKQVLAQVLAKEAKGFLQNRFTQTEVRRLYQSAWAKYRDRGWFRGLLESFVEREETENIRLIQEQVWNLADSIVDPGSEVRCALGKSYDSFLKRLTEDKKLQEEINTWVSANLASLLENRKDFFENLWDSHQENAEKFLAGKILDLVKN